MLTLIRTVSLRAVQVVGVALFITMATALLLQWIPGDAARTVLGERATPETVKALRQEMGIDRPVYRQVSDSFVGLLHGDLGTSIIHRGQDVSALIGPAMLVTASLAGLAILIAVLGGIPAGLGLALVRSSRADLAGRLLVTVLLALPSFMAGLILLYFVSLRLGIAPAGGWAGSWPANLEYLWLPAVALSVYLTCLIARTVRQAALEAIAQPFVEAARTRGVPRRRIVIRHVLPNSLLPVIPLVGFNAGILLGGAVTVEAVFTLPGLGAQLLQGMQLRDLPIVQGVALVTAVAVVVFNLLADLVNIALDPRLRSGR